MIPESTANPLQRRSKNFMTSTAFPLCEYYLKAKNEPFRFSRYCDTLELKLHYDSSRYNDDIATLTTGGAFTGSVKTWWNNTIQKDSLFVRQSVHEWNIARYADGTLTSMHMNIKMNVL